MESEFYILILDRNRHVRTFLKRELERKGYRVLLPKDDFDLTNAKFIESHLDLIVLDPELSDSRGVPIVETTLVSFPGVPIILHTLWQDKTYCSCHPSIIACIEKDGSSIDSIQQTILDMICQRKDSQKVAVGTATNFALKKDERHL